MILKRPRPAVSDAEIAVQSLAPNYNLLRFKSVQADDVLKILKPGEGFLLIRLGNLSSYGFYLADGEVFVYPIDLILSRHRLRLRSARCSNRAEKCRRGSGDQWF